MTAQAFPSFSCATLSKKVPSAIRSILLLFFLLMGGYNLSAQEARYDFNLSGQTLPEGLWELSEKTGIQIVFSNNDFTNQPVSCSFRQKTLPEMLTSLLEGSGLTFSLDKEQVLICKKPIPKMTVSGYVEDLESGERLIGATVVERHSGKGTSTNEYGFFSLTLSAAIPVVEFSYLGYQPNEMSIHKSGQLWVKLIPSLTLKEIIVTDKDSLDGSPIEKFTSEVLINERIKGLPTLGGEVDVLRMMQQLPGVQSGTDGLGGLHVRGGEADQNLVLLDGVPIYNPYHALGLFSIFDHQIIKKVNYLRGSFPARFGGRLSSVVDVRTKEGNNQVYHVHGSIGLIASKAAVEGPLEKDKGAFFISARRTHLDPFLRNYSERQLSDNTNTGRYNYYFGEVISKLNYSLSQKDKIYLSFYKGKDYYYKNETEKEDFQIFKSVIKSRQELNWGNTLGVFRWNHQFSNQIFANLTSTYSQFRFTSSELHSSISTFNNESFSQYLQSTYRSRINTASLKYDLDYIPTANHYIRAGIVASQHFFTPGAVSLQDSTLISIGMEIPDSLISGSKQEVLEGNIYLEDEWRLSDKLKINGGIWAAVFAVPDKNYVLLDPRFTAYWQCVKILQFHVSANRMSQQLHLLTRTGTGFPSDLWVPSTSKVKPQRSWLLEVGLDWMPASEWSISGSVYYKKMDELIGYIEGANFLPNADVLSSSDWEDKITRGSGLSKGVELLLKKETANHAAWISYTLSKTTRQFEGVNGGATYPFRFDQRHVLHLSYAQMLNKQWAISGSWSFQSGSRISLALNEWEYVRQDGKPDFIYQHFENKNNYTLPPYHRLDIAVRYKKNWPRGQWSADLGIYNVYNRRNIYFINADYNPGTKTLGYTAVSLVPVLPYFSLNITI